LRLPKLFNLRTDPLERADTTSKHLLRLAPLQAVHAWAGGRIVEEFLKTFKEFRHGNGRRRSPSTRRWRR